MLSFALGILSGIGLSFLAILVGKKNEVWINQPLETKPGMAEIIKKTNPIEEIINGWHSDR